MYVYSIGLLSYATCEHLKYDKIMQKSDIACETDICHMTLTANCHVLASLLSQLPLSLTYPVTTN